MGKIAVIGSGFGGLAAAIRLAARGHDVDLFEQRDKLMSLVDFLQEMSEATADYALYDLILREGKALLGCDRAVIDPRGVLREFGLEVGEDVEIRVWDSTSEMRYLVLPERPAGSEGLSEDELAALVTRDAMIGTAKVTLQGNRR